MIFGLLDESGHYKLIDSENLCEVGNEFVSKDNVLTLSRLQLPGLTRAKKHKKKYYKTDKRIF